MKTWEGKQVITVATSWKEGIILEEQSCHLLPLSLFPAMSGYSNKTAIYNPGNWSSPKPNHTGMLISDFLQNCGK